MVGKNELVTAFENEDYRVIVPKHLQKSEVFQKITLFDLGSKKADKVTLKKTKMRREELAGIEEGERETRRWLREQEEYREFLVKNPGYTRDFSDLRSKAHILKGDSIEGIRAQLSKERKLKKDALTKSEETNRKGENV